MLKTNRDRLVMLSVAGEISAPASSSNYRVDIDGNIFTLPGTGGISYNLKIGSPACGWAVDHCEPGVSTKNYDSDKNASYNLLSCIGNEVRVTSGDAKGARGFVTGTHGGIEHVLVWFAHETLEKLNIGDGMLVRSFGQGLELTDHPEIIVRNLDPSLMDKMNITERGESIVVPVAKRVPAHLMGSGLGANSTNRGDYDITLFDRAEADRYGLMELRLGDIVLLENCDNSYGRNYITDAVSIGVVVHSDCKLMGHGPGVTTLFTCKKPLIEGVIDSHANLADIMGV